MTRSRFVSNSVALVVLTVLTSVLTLAQVKLLAAMLSRETFGLFAALRGLSLLVSLLAANGIPALLVRFLPEHEARGEGGRALVLGGVALFITSMLCVLLSLGVHIFQSRFFSGVAPDVVTRGFLVWFYVTTLAVSLKLVVYGGLSGIRRFSSQTILEVLALAVQLVWIYLERNQLSMEALFRITGVVSMATVVIGAPWFLSRAWTDSHARVGDVPRARSYRNYWVGAVGLSVVAIAFSDVDRYVLSGVLAFEMLSLFHIGSRIVRLANRFMSVPVLAFQPEVTRMDSQRRADDVRASTQVFIRFNLAMSTLIAVGVMAYARDIVVLVASPEYLGAVPLIVVMALSLPMTAATAPLTTVMKARDGVGRAFWCDLVWAVVYVSSLVLLSRAMGVVGAGWAQVAATAAQLVLAVHLAGADTSAPRIAAWAARVVGCAVLSLAPVIIALALGASGTTATVLRLFWIIPALFVYRFLLRRVKLFTDTERERLSRMLSAAGAGSLVKVLP